MNIACNSSNGSTIDSGITWLYVGAPLSGSSKNFFITNISNNFKYYSKMLLFFFRI